MGLLDFINKLSGTIGAVAGPVGTAAQAVGGLSALIPKPDQSKLGATDVQQNIEKVTLDVDRRLKSGELTPEVALIILSGLERQAQQMASGAAGNVDFLRGSQTALLNIQNVKSNALAAKAARDTAPIGEAGLSGDASTQVGQFSTALRNRMINNPAGDVLRGTPVDQLLTTRPSPTTRLPDVTKSVTDAFGSGPDNTDFMARLKSKLDQPAATPRY